MNLFNKGLLGLFLCSLSVSSFAAPIESFEGAHLKVLSKSCNGQAIELKSPEHYMLANSMLIKFSQASADESKVCQQLQASTRLMTSQVKTKFLYQEAAQLMNPIKRVVCRDVKSNSVLSDQTTQESSAEMSMLLEFKPTHGIGTLKISGSAECVGSDLIIELSQK